MFHHNERSKGVKIVWLSFSSGILTSACVAVLQLGYFTSSFDIK